MFNTEKASPRGVNILRAFEWWITFAVAVAGMIMVWTMVVSGPQICGYGFASAENCFLSDRQRIGWIATVAICVSVAGFVAASFLFKASEARRLVWALSLVIIVASGAFAFLALA